MTAWLAVLGLLAAAQEDWPQFQGPRGDSRSAARGVPREWGEQKNIRWKTPIHGRGWSSPVILGRQVWMTTATPDGKELYAVAVDRETGKVVHDVKVFDVENPPAINPLNSYASPTPALEEGRAYVHFGSMGTACLDTTTGKTLWARRDLPCDHFRGPGSSPFLWGDLLVLHFDGFDVQYVAALDKKSGKTVWKTDRGIDYGTDNGDFKKAFCTPIVIEVGGQPQLVSPGSRATIAYEPLTGKEIWRVRYAGFSSTARPLFGHGLLFLNTGFGKADLMAVRPDGKGDVTLTHVVWTVREGIGSKPSSVLVDDLLYVVNDTGGIATCLEARTGQTVWKKRVGGGQHSASPVAADGAVYFFDHDGVGTVVKAAREYEEFARNRLDDGCMASPAVAGKALYVRTRSALYRIEAP